MDTLHTVLRAISGETKGEISKSEAKPDHLTVFREFLAHLDAIQRKAQAGPKAAPPAKRRARPARRKSKRAK
jgi:hypothetical protein